jgi:hypothetical protein
VKSSSDLAPSNCDDEELDPLIGETLEWYRVGFNFYFREHNLRRY